MIIELERKNVMRKCKVNIISAAIRKMREKEGCGGEWIN